MISAEELVGEEWAEWYRLTPRERWHESEKLWLTYLSLGGSLDPEPDTQSPFFDSAESRAGVADGRAERAALLEKEFKGLRRKRVTRKEGCGKSRSNS